MRYTLRSERIEEAIDFINYITHDKDDCICKRGSCKECTADK
jgi:ArsR family transcriptional regulator